MKRGFVPCSECFDPVPISGPDDKSAGVMCLDCAEGGVGNNIDIVVYAVGAAPERRSVPNRLAEFQRLVGGYIEMLGIGSGVYVVCNEEGKREGLRPNRLVNREPIVGDFFVTAVTNSFHRSLTDDEISWVLTLLDGSEVPQGREVPHGV